MTTPKTAPQPAENFWAQVDAMRSELAADIREVFDANGPETPQIVRDVIEYADSWLQVAIQRESERSARPQPPAGIWVPTELAERVHETMGEFLMNHGWRQIDMNTSDEFGALLAVATKAAPAPAVEAGGPLNELEELNLLNKLIKLGARAANAHAKSNSDDGQAGTAAYVEWTELRACMRELIRKAYAAPHPAAQGDALDAEKHCLEMGESFRALRRVVNLLLEARRNLGPEDHELRDRIDRLLRDDAARAAQGGTKA